MNLSSGLTRVLDAQDIANPLQAPVGLLVRLWVASVFFKSGLVKIQSWDATLALFEYEYSVPLLPPDLAALLGTAAELGLPVLLALGLASRYTALALFVFNIVAVLSYPALGPAGIEQHQVWGLLLLVTLAFGPGRWSLDAVLTHWRALRGARLGGPAVQEG